MAGKLPRVVAQFTGHILHFRHQHSVVRFVLYIIHVARHLYDIMSVIIYMILRVQLVNACNGLATQLDTDSPSGDLV